MNAEPAPVPETGTIGLSKKEAQFVRTLIRVDTDLEADECGQQLTVAWEQARELDETLMEHAVPRWPAHTSGARTVILPVRRYPVGLNSRDSLTYSFPAIRR